MKNRRFTSDSTLIQTAVIYVECGKDARKAGKELGVHPRTVERRIEAAEKRGLLEASRVVRASVSCPNVPDSAKVPSPKNGLSRADFRAQYDHDTKTREAVRKGVKALGPDEILQDTEFRQEVCGCANAQGWRQIANETEFLKYQFRCDSKTWWAATATVTWALNKITKARPPA